MPYFVRNKIAFLSEASKILSSSLDYNVTLAILAKLITDSIADFCIIDIIEKDELVRLVVRTSDPKKQSLAQKFSEFKPHPSNKRAIYEAARIGKPILIRRVSKTWLKTVSKIPEEIQTVMELGLKSMIFAPLKSREKVIGVITIGSCQADFHYSPDDCIFIEELAVRAGTAVDKARLFKDAQDAIKLRDEFVSIASHELRTPLTSISLNLQLILEKIHKATNQKATMKEIERLIEINLTQSKRLSRLINDLLNTSVISSGKLTVEREKVNLKKLIKEVVEKNKEQFKKSKIILSFKSPKKIVGNWDPVRLEQVFSNMISNASKYGNRKPVRIKVGTIADKAIVKISDRGIGIAKEDQPYIFDLFRRAVDPNDYKGLGIGLFISRQIIEAHGGSITLESKPGRGTSFTIELPLEG